MSILRTGVYFLCIVVTGSVYNDDISVWMWDKTTGAYTESIGTGPELGKVSISIYCKRQTRVSDQHYVRTACQTAHSGLQAQQPLPGATPGGIYRRHPGFH